MLRSGFFNFQVPISLLSKSPPASINLCKYCQGGFFTTKGSKRKITTFVNTSFSLSTHVINSTSSSASEILLLSKLLLVPKHKGVRPLSSSTPPPPPPPPPLSKDAASSGTIPPSTNDAASSGTPVTEFKDSAVNEGLATASASLDQQDSAADGEKRKNKLLKVTPRLRKDTALSYNYTGNIYILQSRALKEYLLKPSDLENLPKYSRRSPYATGDKLTVYLRSDVEEIAMKRWGSFDQLNKERARIEQDFHGKYDAYFHLRSLLGDSHKSDGRNPDDAESRSMAEGTPPGDQAKEATFLSSGATKVVVSAIVINGANSLLKLVAWLYSGSHSMFSEFIHSCADTMNQIILGIGLYHSFKKPDTDHPYGYTNLRHISSLISGVGIFFLGTGLSWYHSFQGFLHPTLPGSLTWCLASLVGSFVSEGATLLIAIHQIQKSSKAMQMSFKEYVQSGVDPNVTVVLLEDMAAVAGVVVAGVCISITHVTGSPFADAFGSALIGSLLGGVAGFIIYNNTTHLVGRSIPLDERHEISQLLETDRMIRSLHDIKATQMGGMVRYKAEVDFDGREITRAYLYKQDLDLMLAEAHKLQTVEDLENFMLNHGEKVIDTLGGEVDRIEKSLKSKHPEIRHVDLEAL